MKAIFRTFESGAGDCIFIILKDEDSKSSYHIMVDCNVFTDKIQSFIAVDLEKRLDILIITHIDSDHINGITRMMRDPEFQDMEIGKIIFNCFQPQADRIVSLAEDTLSALELAKDLLPQSIILANYKTSCHDVI